MDTPQTNLTTAQLNELAHQVREARSVVVFTGAGVSTAAGIPDFRSRDGIWAQWEPTRVGHISALDDFPDECWNFYAARLQAVGSVVPTRLHEIVASWDKARVVTQNVDQLHQRAGSAQVAELHGQLTRIVCSDQACAFTTDAETALALRSSSADGVPRCPQGHLLRTGVVMFGEMLPQDPWDLACGWLVEADLVIVTGTSLKVSPASHLPEVSLQGGLPAKLVLINNEPTPRDRYYDLVIRTDAQEAFEHLADAGLLGGADRDDLSR